MSPDRYADATVAGERVRVVNPAHFYAADVPGKGQGLFCQVVLEPGDCWWAHDFEDQRYVTRVIPWSEYEPLDDTAKRDLERLCYIDVATRSLVACTEPFCRVNHGGHDANSRSDDNGCSIVTKPVPAGTEITIPYDFDPVLSILWKFPGLKDRLSASELADESLMFGSIENCETVKRFLESLP